MFMEQIGAKGRLIGLDLDDKSLAKAQERLKTAMSGDKDICTLDLFSENFANIGVVLKKLGISGADLILLDLGISSYQLDTPERGFSFTHDALLDMRMSAQNPVDAAMVVNQYSEEKLADIFKQYGEERFARRIAHRIAETREIKSITTTAKLADTIRGAVPGYARHGRIHPATRVFQALRIEVNRELDNLAKFLLNVPGWLNPGGRVGVISFHSLEDRLVKRSFKENHEKGIFEIKTKKPIMAEESEQEANPRSRSAKLRVALKVVESRKKRVESR